MRTLAIVAVAAAAALLPTASPTPPGRGTAASWGIAPVPGPSPRGGLDHHVDPGRSVTDAVRVTNLGHTPLSLRLAALDAITTPSGAFDVIDEGEAATGAGAWIRLDRTTLTLPARTSADVGLVLAVPPDAEPGDHAAGIVAVADTTDAAGQVLVQRRVGTRVHVHVRGTARTGLTVSGLVTRYRDPVLPGAAGTLTVEYLLRNTGTVRVGAASWIDVRGPRGMSARRHDAPTLRQVLPGAAVAVVERLEVRPAGPLDITVTARPLSAPRLDPVTDGGRRLFGAPDATAGVQQWAWPWSLTVTVLALAAGAALLLRRRASPPPTPEEAP